MASYESAEPNNNFLRKYQSVELVDPNKCFNNDPEEQVEDKE